MKPIVTRMLRRCLLTLPSSDSLDYFVWIGGPREGLRLGVVLDDEAIDYSLQVDDGCGAPHYDRRLVSLAKKPSTAFRQDAEVG